MFAFINAIAALFLGAWVGKFIAFSTRELPKILMDDQEEREPEDLPGEFFQTTRCPSCRKPLSWFQHFPIIGYIYTSGKCPHCGVARGKRDLMIEGVCALLFFYVFFMSSTLLTAVVVSAACSFLVAAFVTDFENMILPDQITYPLLWVGLIASLAPVYVSPRYAIIGAVAGYGVFWLINAFYRYLRGYEGMYPGDFKLNAAVGALVGWQWLFPIILVSLFFLVVFTVIGVVFKSKKLNLGILQEEAPYGCYSSVMTVMFLLWSLIG